MGQLTFREWRVCWRVKEKHPILYSAFINFPWESDRVTADQLPEKEGTLGNLHGIHSFKSWCNSITKLLPAQGPGMSVVAQGAVDSYGLIRHHTDGVIRSEHARVLALRVVPGDVKNCEHFDRGFIVNKYFDPNTKLIIYCTCKLSYLERLIEGAKEIFLPDLEEMLVRYYEVERLPMGVGPWPPPYGSGPDPVPEGE